MINVLQNLIDKYDTFEIVRDQLALLLATESANQQALATTAGKDPALWKLRVYTERAAPWETFLNDPLSDTSPLVNIWFDNTTFDRSASDPIKRQKSDAIYNLDCYGLGVSASDGDGQIVGDREAAFETHRAIRLVRNILMSSINAYLQLNRKNLIWGSRWPQSIVSFQPEQGGRQIQRIVGARIKFEVSFNEYSPQYEGDNLEIVGVDIKRSYDGQIIAQAEYD